MAKETLSRLFLSLLICLLLGFSPGCARQPAGALTPVSPTSTLPPSPTPQVTASPTMVSLAEDAYAQERRRMVEWQMKSRDITEESVLRVMAKVPRHEFVPSQYLHEAYADHPLPIGYGQTISQPYIVALMTQLLQIKPGDRVLEIGTGSGYQAAILAEITDQVYTVEIIPELAKSAEERLKRLGYTQVRAKQADGYYGWEEYAPYDAIIVTCAPDHIPQPLVQQLKDGGRLVIPVGPVGGFQTLWRITKKGDQLRNENMGGVSFVPLTGGH